MSSRTISIFLEQIRSKKTQDAYLYYLENFVSYFKLRDIESIISIEQSKLQEMIEDYVIFQKREGLSYSYINGHKSALKALIESNDILLNWKKIIRMMPEQEKKRGQKAWKRKEIQSMLDCSKGVKSRALILFLTCGCRIGAIPDMTMQDMIDMPDGCKKLIVYRDSKYEYVTFLTPEASQAFEQYLQKRINDGERIDRNSPLFRSKYILGMQKVSHTSAKALTNIMNRAQHNAGLRDPSTKKNGRYEVATDHGFRKYFNTILKTTNNLNRSLAEKMMGHNSRDIPLDTEYLDEEMMPELSFTEFKKAIPELTIDDSARKQALLEQKEQQIDELKKKEVVIVEMKQKIENLSKEQIPQDLLDSLIDDRLEKIMKKKGININ